MWKHMTINCCQLLDKEHKANRKHMHCWGLLVALTVMNVMHRVGGPELSVPVSRSRIAWFIPLIPLVNAWGSRNVGGFIEIIDPSFCMHSNHMCYLSLVSFHQFPSTCFEFIFHCNNTSQQINEAILFYIQTYFPIYHGPLMWHDVPLCNKNTIFAAIYISLWWIKT